MKFKLLLITAILTIFSINVFAKPVVDSIGVENHNGKKVIVYKIKKKDNYYSLGRRFHVPPKEIIAYNDNAKMTIGHVIKIPTDRPFKEPKHETASSEKKHKKKEIEQPTEAEQPEQQQVVQHANPVQQPPQPQPQPADNTPPTQYKVSPKETLYSIAKRFNTTVDDIMKQNNLTSNNIQPGQILNIKANVQGAPAAAATTQTTAAPAQASNTTDSIVAKRDSTTMVVSTQDSSNIEAYHASANKFGLYEKDEKGAATWIDDENLDPNKKLVLHRTAPIGTVIRITNIMTNRTTFAKVVGRFADNEQTKDVIIVMTKNVAESLGALDKRFQVTLSYGVPNEQ
ncbi:LysM peptidoglycan-binding domain-containing protein [Mucilaginibacter ginsenosidivorans]|uniref:LysM peptidoglycan-binding domain-containing protein n=1 Tax=Mucilaginibacter ginsenosidivorans TaxID=398053 RepID=A0A5B8UYM1_9SPHI|nr:LysM peptidoglycan-binding domain-containing protein [Mucilaginibacter ginsenosidivorans]QEC64092.1 LysM peptidoglycan-binding domain-containing protein [Mucilaginibacter ginsenosidivorans]